MNNFPTISLSNIIPHAIVSTDLEEISEIRVVLGQESSLNSSDLWILSKKIFYKNSLKFHMGMSYGQ